MPDSRQYMAKAWAYSRHMHCFHTLVASVNSVMFTLATVLNI